MPNPNLNRFYIALFSITVSCFVVILGFVSLHFYAKSQQVNFANKLLNLVDEIAIETRTNLTKLNKYNNSVCDEQLMRIMRQTLFQSKHAKEIGFYHRDMQLCNTSLGLFKEPIKTSEPDLNVNPSQDIWIYKPSGLFDQSYPTFIIKVRNFHVVIDPREIISQTHPELLWQWVYHDADKTLALFGESELYNKNVSKKASIVEVNGVYCSAQVKNCIATYKNLWNSINSNEFLLAFVSLFILTVCFYITGMFVIRYWFSPELRLKRGIANKCFYPLFQPIVELNTGKIVGCEVLARFKDKLGLMGPEDFIFRVSSMKKTIPFTCAILKSATSELIRQANLPNGFKVNFNLFPNDLTDTNLARLAAHKAFFANRFNICFEITEDEPFNNKASHLILRKLKALGVDIAIDDFGTGYSNLDQLQSIPFDYLKIDKGFCMGLERSTFRAGLIPQIVKIANLLDVPVVAEGVETESQRVTLVNEAVEYGQGYLFGKPMSAQELNALISSQQG